MTATPNRTKVEGSGTAAAGTPSAVEPVPPSEAPPLPLAAALPALADEVVATPSLSPLVSATVSVVASVAGDEAPSNAPNTT